VRFLAATLLALAVPAWAAETPKAAKSQAVVRDIRGIARLKAVASQTWSQIRKGDLLNVGDSVRTLEGSRMQLMMRGGGLVTLGPLAQIEISDPTIIRATAAGGVATRLKLIVGGLFARVHTEITKEDFAIETPSAVAAVKGCGFGLYVSPGLDSHLVTLEGLVKFMNEHGTVDVHAMQEAHMGPTGGPGAPETFDPRQSPVWLGGVAGDDDQTVKVTITDADGGSHDVILKFKKP
jgi:hypothetical protein